MKIKNTFFKGKMNKDVDERLIPEGEYIDASNIRVLKASGSNAGAIENERGNEKVSFLSESNNPVCIGSVSDEANERIYWFVVNDLGHSFVYEYEAKTGSVTTVLADTRTTNVLNFDKDHKITGVNIIYNIYNKRYLLVFTDGLNSPRCINIARAKGYGANGFQSEDIDLYKKAPRTAPEVVGFITSDVSENEVKERFFAFSCRYKYLDGEYSALSSFTNYQFTPSNFELDFDTMENKGMVNVFNAYRITFNTGDKRVTDIQVCFKNPNNNTVYVIDTINKKEKRYIDNSDQSIVFNNSKLYAALPEDELNRIFDDIPLTAKAQDFVENRLIYGNITSQYDLFDSEDGSPITVDYVVDQVSIQNTGSDGTRTIEEGELNVTLDLTGLSLIKGYLFYIGASVTSDEVGTDPNTYFGGTHLGESAVVLSRTYLAVGEFVASSDFEQLLDSLNGSFVNAVESTPPTTVASTQYGDYTLDSSTSTTIVLTAPTITYTLSDSSTEIEEFKWQEETIFALRQTASLYSLKSNRSYEFGIAYLDSFGRYSSVIPSANKTRNNPAEIFVPIKNSVDINRAKVTINSEPPYWADRYKFFMKSNKKEHYTIYATTFYEEGVYRWVLLTGNNLFKVEAGTNLIVKSDDLGPLIDEVKVKVLEVVTKTVSDLNQTSEGKSDEGWLDGNRNAADQKIKELYGTYMKIKPVGFQMDFNPFNFSFYENSNKIKAGLNSQNRGFVSCFLPKPTQTNFGLAQFEDENASLFNIELTEGTKIIFNFNSFESIDLNNNSSRNFVREYILGDSYTGDDNISGIEKFMIEETTWYKPVGQTYYTDPNEQFKLYFERTYFPSGSRHFVKVESTEETGLLERAYITASIQIVINPEGTLIFETDPKDLDSEVYYETSETFNIVNGYHAGNTQNQDASNPAICTLDIGNCFSFGNGVESIQVRDERLANSYNIDLRPNIVLVDGYKKRELTNTLTFSGPINPNTAYNTINEFNASRGITKLLDAKYGSIQRIYAREGDLVVFQEDKVQKILYGKALIYSGDGTASLTTIESVLGTEVPFTGEYGISKNPESLSVYAGNMYFTDAARGTVLRLGNDGLTPISYYGMRAYFKENLFNYKDSYNLGGFDPNSHQYVLSMNQSAFPIIPTVVECSADFMVPVKSGESYSYGIAVTNAGDLTIDYTVTGTVSIVISSNSGSQTNASITGTGTLTYTVSEGDLAYAPEVNVVVTSSEDAVVDLHHSCPVVSEREMNITVFSDINIAGQTIQNSYSINSSPEIIYQDVFSETGISRKEVFVGEVDSIYAPAEGDTVTVKSTRLIGEHTGSFNSQSSIGYLISPDSKTNTQILAEATYPNVTTVATADKVENFISFTFNEFAPGDKLYIVWSYGFAGSTGGEEDPVAPDPCVDNTHTFYIGGAFDTFADMVSETVPFGVNTEVRAEYSQPILNANTTLCAGGSELVLQSDAYYVVKTSPSTIFNASTEEYYWWRINGTGRVVDWGLRIAQV
jgi:hypothetical protein